MVVANGKGLVGPKEGPAGKKYTWNMRKYIKLVSNRGADSKFSKFLSSKREKGIRLFLHRSCISHEQVAMTKSSQRPFY